MRRAASGLCARCRPRLCHQERAIADPEITDVALTTEEEGVAVAAGAWLGGQRAVL
ncbi:hypothetical protein [Comamonas sp. JC664]|uniref:hypothetical protein n=1 Tax=Comamonas sp. JC664 TaxID=2801917 RepID=UPI003607AE94